jgi:hypothetical protein
MVGCVIGQQTRHHPGGTHHRRQPHRTHFARQHICKHGQYPLIKVSDLPIGRANWHDACWHDNGVVASLQTRIDRKQTPHENSDRHQPGQPVPMNFEFTTTLFG